MKSQVDKKHYNFDKYGHVERFASYYYQLKEVLKCNPKSILEVGVGDKVFGNYVKENTNIKYASLDIAKDLHPDIIGSVFDIPCGDGAYDVVCCFEVLEHVSYSDVQKALSELTRVAKKAVIISVPHFGPRTQFFLKLPFLPEIKFALKVPWKREHIFNGEHHWELGKKDFPADNFKKLVRKYGKIVNDFIPFENQFHHFYVIYK